MSTTDDQAPQSIEELLASLPPEQRAAAEAQMVANMLAVPAFGMVIQWDIGTGNGPEGPFVLVDVKCNAGGIRLPFNRDAALQFSSEIRKAAQTGPKLQIAQPGQVPGL